MKNFNVINYNYNDNIDKLLTRYFKTLEKTLDTIDFIEAKHIKKIKRKIIKNMYKQMNNIAYMDKLYQKQFYDLHSLFYYFYLFITYVPRHICMCLSNIFKRHKK